MMQRLHCPHCGEPIPPLIQQAGLTPRQAEALEAIRTYIDEHGSPPSYEELLTPLGLKNKSKVTGLLDRLEDRGYIRRRYGKPRSISLVECEA